MTESNGDESMYESKSAQILRNTTQSADQSKNVVWTPELGWDHSAYVAYVAECEAENLEPHSPHMWQVHGCPSGPLG